MKEPAKNEPERRPTDKIGEDTMPWKKVISRGAVSFHCSLCKASRKTKKGLQKHINNHPKCGLCPEYFRSRKGVARHMEWKHGSSSKLEPQVCFVCHKTMKHYGTLLQHQKHHHPEIIFGFNSQRQFECYLCHSMHKSQPLLRTHIRAKHVWGRFILCTKCGKYVRNNSELNKHMLRADHNASGTDIRPFKCDQCDKSFFAQFELNLHIRRGHTSERTLQCDECPKKFKTKSNLSQHRLTHEPPRHPCHLCSYSGRAAGCLRKHMRSHMGRIE